MEDVGVCSQIGHRVKQLPLEFNVIQWDGSEYATGILRYWVTSAPNGKPGFRIKRRSFFDWAWAYVFTPVVHVDQVAEVYNILSRTWIPVHKNQWVLKGPVGEFYPVAEEALYRLYKFICHTTELKKEE